MGFLEKKINMFLSSMLLQLDMKQAASDTAYFVNAIWGTFSDLFYGVVYTILAVIAIAIIINFFHK